MTLVTHGQIHPLAIEHVGIFRAMTKVVDGGYREENLDYLVTYDLEEFHCYEN